MNRFSCLVLALALSPCSAVAQHAVPDAAQIAERQQYARSIHGSLRKKSGVLRNLGIPSGTHRIRFTVAPDGKVSDINLIDDTGNEKANARLLNFVLRAAPFPPPPGGQPINFTLPLRYENLPAMNARPKDIMRPAR